METKIKVNHKLKKELANVEAQLRAVISDFSSDEFAENWRTETPEFGSAEISLAKDAIELRAKRRKLWAEIEAMKLEDESNNTI